MAIRVLSIDEALEDIKKSILEKGRGPDKKPRKRRRGIKPDKVLTYSMSKKRHGIEATTEKFKDDVKLERKQRGVKESREDRPHMSATWKVPRRREDQSVHG